MTFKGEIRDSLIRSLLEKVRKRNYNKYLYSVKLSNMRGFADEIITFDFPVTAIIGPNGGGKSTVLGAAACLYSDLKPGRFFAKSSRFDDGMQNWRMEYEVIDKSKQNTNFIKYKTSYSSYKWSREKVVRPVAFFGISRTIPASERAELKKITKTTYKFKDSQIKELTDENAKHIGHILGRNIKGFKEAHVGERGNITFLAGKTENEIEYSEFHFGAGESSIIKMVASIESLPEGALVLIEEIENGLHPIATRRLVEYLVEVADRKKMQFIFSTHSNDALLPLPTEAIWSAINKKLVQGKLDILALRTITGEIDKQLAIFTEDIFSELWVENVIRINDPLIMSALEVHGLQGDGTAVKIHKNHNSDPSVKFRSICFIDGDSKQEANDAIYQYRLPGSSPERYIFDSIMSKISELIGEITVSLHLNYEKQGEVMNILNQVSSTNRDEHIIFSQIGERLGFLSENVVQNAFLSVWVKKFPIESKKIFSIISDNIPQYGKGK
ncbi:ATP-dependent nuclease [Leptospira santarosai]|uniref:AAA domain protein n=1 Tax=Leptospira santarosai serovar Arenal str. MAVJ 401 TaxID=1049976 RepID=M6JL21_9LEPT|nr:AAA family ATPase [Leptospira santarosai]EMN22411.1 AAA domain protein [Leptospira santarosai serovar Arenal str. MAVJ 401]